MDEAMRVSTVDYHTAGEPFRIVLAGVPDIEGASVLERREVASGSPEIDAYRELLVKEPRGHADMYGCFLVPADDDGAHFGVLFWHKDGYSTACGHGTIALGAWAVESGRVASQPTGVDRRGDRRALGTGDGSGHDGGRRGDAGRVRERRRVRDRPRRAGRDQQGTAAPWTSATGGRSTPRSRPRARASAWRRTHHNELVAVGREIKWALNATDVGGASLGPTAGRDLRRDLVRRDGPARGRRSSSAERDRLRRR